MWIVAIAWMYVALMMSMAEATSPQGTVLGAVITFLFYGVGPLALVMYLLGTPARRRALRQREAEERSKQMAAPAASTDADARSLPPGDAIAPEGKEP
jgi:hypothetical protein